MVIKKYIVNNMNEAMTRIRYELGKDAVIINQRKIKKTGFLGLFGKKVIEVTAAVENSGRYDNKDQNMKSSIEALKKVMQKEFPADNVYKENRENVQNQATRIQNTGSQNDLIKEMQEMKNILNSMVKPNTENSESRSKLELKLLDNDIDERLVKRITTGVNKINETISELEKAKKVISSMIKLSDDKMDGKIVLVGPTGVGKTTTIAKLAGRLSLIEKKKVGLITIDTYRIGAVEQLKTYADIMNIPFKVVLTIKEMDAAIESMKECDIVLIDTTGRSSKNKMQISELRAFVDRVNTDNINLVISATTKNKDIEAILDGYKILNYNKLVITKLDETSTYGSILNILDIADKPLNFVTVGQSVPDDIKKYSKTELTNFILGEDSIC